MANCPWHTLSLCSGVGGLDLAVRLAVPNARTVCMVEREAFAVAVLAARMEEGYLDACPVWSDVRTFDGRAWRGIVDCIIAGIPCQGNSLAGKRLLEEDPRDLWDDTRRILREVGPQFFFLENVAGFLVPGRKRSLSAPAARVLGELAEDGWDAEWLSLPASTLGATQKRERFFLLARCTGDRWRQQDRPQTKRESVLAWCSTALDDGNGPQRRANGRQDRPQTKREDTTHRTSSGAIPLFPPAPACATDWRRVIGSHAHLTPALSREEIESAVRQLADGVANPVDLPIIDSIRAAGNGVVPVQGAAAFAVLYRRLMERNHGHPQAQ